MSEEFRDIAGHPGYKIGSNGTVLTFWPKGPNPSNRQLENGRIRKPYQCRGGHLQVTLRNPEGKTYSQKLVHVLVLEAFVGPRPEGMIARHFPDPDPTNNSVTNLRWGTHEQNCQDRDRDGNTARGARGGNTKLTDEMVHEIRSTSPYRGYTTDLCKKFGVCRTTIHAIRKREIWTHI